jgi:tol-pal system protein YbgF
VVIDSVSNDLRVLREKVDDNSVRVGSVGQELDALRQSVVALSTARTSSFGEPDPTVIPPGGDAVAPTGAAAVGASPQKLFEGAMADYYSAQYDLAIIGFESYAKTFPQSPQASDAQFHIGQSYGQQGKYDKAADAYSTLLKNYPRSREAAEGYVKLGLAYRNLKQEPKARESWEFVIKNYPGTDAATMAQQYLSTPQKP